MASQQNEAEDLNAKVHSHVKAKSAVEPKGETSLIGKLKAKAMKLFSILKAGNVTKANKTSGNPGTHSQYPSDAAAAAITATET